MNLDRPMRSSKLPSQSDGSIQEWAQDIVKSENQFLYWTVVMRDFFLSGFETMRTASGPLVSLSRKSAKEMGSLEVIPRQMIPMFPVHNSQKKWKQPKYPLTEEEIKKMW